MRFSKILKPKLILSALTLLIFSCDIVNSLFPFYTPSTIYFEEAIVGTWANKFNKEFKVQDNKNGFTDKVDYIQLWRFKAVNNLKDTDTLINFIMLGPGADNLNDYKKKYRDGYVACYEDIEAFLNIDGSMVNPIIDESYIEPTISVEEAFNPDRDFSKNPKIAFYKKKVAWFMVMPFKINNQLFLDFTPLHNYSQLESINSLLVKHYIETHSLAIVNMVSKSEIDISWLVSRKVDSLIKYEKINIKHEKYGVNAFLNKSVLLTAPTEELQSFIKKYMNSKDKKKWDDGEGIKLNRYYEKS